MPLRHPRGRVLRLVSALSVLALLVVPAASAIPAGSLGGVVITVTPVDRDGNGLWDTVLVNVTLNVTRPGLFEVEAMFYALGPAGYVRSMDGVDVNLTAGSRTVSVPLDATPAHARDGPYLVAVIVSTVDGIILTPLESLTQATLAWAADRFDEPAVQLDGSPTDQGVDVHGDGLYDELVVHVPLKVLRPTVVQLSGRIYSSIEPSRLAPAVLLRPGATTWNVVFDGTAIRYQRNNGSYRVDLTLTGPQGSTIGITYQTQYHAYTEFARPPADFRGAPTLAAVDTNGNGKAEFLQIRVPLRVRLPGNYTVVATGTTFPGPALPFPFPERHVRLDPGDREVDLNVSGIALSRLPGAMPMYVQVLVFPFAAESTLYPFGNATIASYAAFDPAAFEPRVTENLTVGVLNACSYVMGVADPSTGFVYVPWFYASNPITLPLYNGTFDVLVSDCNRTSQVTSVRVQGATFVNLTLPAGTGPTLRRSFNLTSWTAGTVDYAIGLGTYSGFVRWWADYFGNLDGTASPEELSRVVDGICCWNQAWDFAESDLLDAQRGYAVGMDGVDLDRAWTEALVLGPAASVTSSAPAGITLRDHLEAMGPVASTGQHRVTVDLPVAPWWPRVFSNRTLALRLPVGGSGNLTATGHVQTPYAGFDLASNASVTQTGPGSWDISLPEPSPYYGPILPTRLTVAAVQTGGRADLTGILVLGSLPIVVLVAIVLVLFFRGRRQKPNEPGDRTPPPNP